VGSAGGAITGATDRSGNGEAVFATTRTDANALADRAFYLVVVCWAPGTPDLTALPCLASGA
jgi:hypothetical protein